MTLAPLALALGLLVPPAKPIRVSLGEATVFTGMGRGEGTTPPPTLRAHVELSELPPKARPRIKAWRTTAGGLKHFAQVPRPRAGATLLEADLQGGPSAFELTAPWPEEPPTQKDRLVVEVFLGRRRVAWTAAEVRTQPRREAGRTDGP